MIQRRTTALDETLAEETVQNPLMAAALTYAARGLHVFPVHGIKEDGKCDCEKSDCDSPGKRPRTPDGLKSATTDTATIKKWWKRWPQANVAIRTGAASGFFVVDIDGPEGEDFLKGKSWPPTPTATTGRGRHILFKHPGWPVKNGVKVAPEIDVRGDDGYIVIAPSRHSNGAVYRWAEKRSLQEVEFADAPGWVLDLLRGKTAATAKTASGEPQREGDGTIPKGERNVALTRLAGKLRHAGMEEEEIFAALKVANKQRCAEPLLESEVRGIAVSIAKKPAGNSESPTVPQALVKIGQRAQLFHDERHAAYAAVIEEKGQRVMPIRGHDLRTWLSGAYYRETGKAANSEALGAALGVLEARALHDGDRIELSNRFARRGDEIWIDLADSAGRAVRITTAGWVVVERPPILFRRFSHQAPLPTPEKGGDLRELLKFMNIAHEEDQRIFLSWLVVAPIENIPRPALLLHGVQGAAKTTNGRMARTMVDPSASVSVPLRRDDAEVAQVLDHHAMPLFDNLSGITTSQADLLCQAVTGGGFSKRGLYTDDEDRLFSFRRAMILTGITVPTVAPDLLDRSLLIELKRVSPDNRREESELWRDFEEMRPRLFGALLDALAGAMRVYPTLPRGPLPRMADFARWGAAAAESLGYGAQAFVDAYRLNSTAQLEEVLESSPIAAAVRRLVTETGSWQGTPTELYLALTNRRPDTPRLGDGWPKGAPAMAKVLKRLQPALADSGLLVDWGPGHDGKGQTNRKIRIEADNPRKVPSLPSSLSHPEECATETVAPSAGSTSVALEDDDPLGLNFMGDPA
jgi:hypothetical protein